MKTIELNSKKYKCPESWEEITLRQQIKVSADTDKIDRKSEEVCHTVRVL